MRLKRLSTFKLSFASWLILLAMFVALPLIGLSIYSTFRYADDRSQRFELQLHEKAENLALQQDAYFRKIEHLLTALSHSPAAQAGDVSKLYAAAKLLQEGSPEISAISLVDANDTLVFLTLAPLGKVLPVSQIDSVHEAFRTGKPNISNAFKSPSVGLMVYAINVPILRDGRVVYCLRGIFRVENLPQYIKYEGVPKKWIAAIVDRNMVIAMRNVTPEKYVGETASLGLVNAIRSRHTQVWLGTTIEGTRTRAVYKPVGTWGWSVGLGVPEKLLLEPLWNELLETAVLVMALLTVIGGLALGLGYGLARRLKQVAVEARLALTQEPKALAWPTTTRITELDELRDSLTQSESYRQMVQTEVRKRTEELSLAQQQLRAFAIQQEEAIENERLRIAREVHDQLGAVFTGVSLIVNGLENLEPTRKAQLQQALLTGVKTAQRITAELRPPLLDELGLAAAVLEMTKATLGQAGIVCNVALGDDDRLNAQQRIGCYRIIQEAITNVLRHAQASSCSILGGATADGHFVVVVADNGIISPADISSLKSFGLRGMQERAKLMGGTLTFIPLEQGLSVRVMLPVQAQTQAPATEDKSSCTP